MFYTAIQVFLFSLLSFLILQIPFSHLAGASITSGVPFFLYYVFVGILSSWAAFSLSLLISLLLRSQSAAFALVPLVLIPQILFGGLFLPFDSMYRLKHEDVPWYANATFSRWSYEALVVASVTLNPVFRLSENLNDYKESVQSRGGDFVYEDEVGRHWDYLQEFVTDELPEQIATQQFETYIMEAANNLTANDQGTEGQDLDYYADIQEIYSLDDNR